MKQMQEMNRKELRDLLNLTKDLQNRAAQIKKNIKKEPKAAFLKDCRYSLTDMAQQRAGQYQKMARSELRNRNVAKKVLPILAVGVASSVATYCAIKYYFDRH